jgi:competence protein ComEC
VTRSLLVLASAQALGCALGADVGVAGACVLLALAGFLIGMTLARPASGRALASSLPVLAAAATALGAAGAGVEAFRYDREPLGIWLRDRGGFTEVPVRLEGTVRGDARERGDRMTFVLDVDHAQGPFDAPLPRGRVRVDVGGQAERPVIADGDRVRLQAPLSLPRDFGNPGAFDSVAAARRDGIVALGHCKSARLLTWLGRSPEVGFFRGALADGRAAARRRLRASLPAGPEEGLVRAMVLGDRSGLDPQTSEDFRRAGTFHVLALSGAQVALLAALVVGALRLAGLGPRLVAVAASLAIVAYAAFVGADVPIARAALMAVVVLGGRALDLEADLGNLLGLAAGVLLAEQPSSIEDVGFQLSFGATLGLIALTGPVLRLMPPLPVHLDAALAGSVAAQAPLVPLLAWHFHRLTPAALVLNLLAVPLSTAVLLAGLAVVAVADVPAVAYAIGQVAWWAAHALLRSAEPAGWLPGLAPRVASPGLWALAAYVAGLLLVFRRARVLAGALLVIAACVFMSWPRAARGDGRLHLTVLDAGQGDALVLRSPAGRVLMVDAGGTYDGRFDIGEAVIAPYLWSQGIGRLDGIVVSHAHPDHVGGVGALLRGFPVGVVWEGPAPYADVGYTRLDAEIREAGVNRLGVVRGVRETWDGVALRIAGPPAPALRPRRVRNDDSVVLEVSLGETSFLLTGDVEANGEGRLATLPTTVLKVPHHGSRSSSSGAFLDRIHPLVAVVSAGFRNRFSHPDAGVVERYRQRGVRLYTTASDGAVSVATDGSRVWVTTHRGGPSELRLR